MFIHISIILKRRSSSTNRIYVMRHCMDFDQVKFGSLPWRQCSFEWTQCSAQGIIRNWKDKFGWFLFKHFNSPWSSYGKHNLIQKNWISTYSCIRRANFLNVSLVYSLVRHAISYHWRNFTSAWIMSWEYRPTKHGTITYNIQHPNLVECNGLPLNNTLRLTCSWKQQGHASFMATTINPSRFKMLPQECWSSVELKVPALQIGVQRQQNLHLRKNTHPCRFQEFEMMGTLNVS